MAEPAKTEEPSMEDILASIKKIISEDGKPIPQEEMAKAAAPAANAPQPAPKAPEPVAALPKAEVKPAPQPQPAPPPPPAPKAEPAAPPPVAAKPAPQQTPAPAPTPAPKPTEDVLELTEMMEEKPTAAKIADAAINALLAGEDINKIQTTPVAPKAPSAPAAKPQTQVTAPSTFAPMAQAMTETAVTKGWPMGNMNGTMEEMIREIMKPLLNQWLEANLPGITEKLVQAEIEKMINQAKSLDIPEKK